MSVSKLTARRDARLHGAPTCTIYISSIMDSIDPAALSLHPPQQQQQLVATSAHHHHQVYATQSPSPTPSSSSLAVQLQQQSQQSQHQQDTTTVASASIQDPNLPPKPDRTKHDVVKARYRVLQSKWQDLSAVSWLFMGCFTVTLSC